MRHRDTHLLDGPVWWQPWAALAVVPCVMLALNLVPLPDLPRLAMGLTATSIGLLFAFTGIRWGNPNQRMTAILAAVLLLGLSVGLLGTVVQLPMSGGLTVETAAY